MGGRRGEGEEGEEKERKEGCYFSRTSVSMHCMAAKAYGDPASTPLPVQSTKTFNHSTYLYFLEQYVHTSTIHGELAKDIFNEI